MSERMHARLWATKSTPYSFPGKALSKHDLTQKHLLLHQVFMYFRTRSSKARLKQLMEGVVRQYVSVHAAHRRH